GIRDGHVTGVQTCALPIFVKSKVHGLHLLTVQATVPPLIPCSASRSGRPRSPWIQGCNVWWLDRKYLHVRPWQSVSHEGWGELRSEERRVGKECRDGCGGE